MGHFVVVGGEVSNLIALNNHEVLVFLVVLGDHCQHSALAIGIEEHRVVGVEAVVVNHHYHVLSRKLLWQSVGSLMYEVGLHGRRCLVEAFLQFLLKGYALHLCKGVEPVELA